MAALRPDHDRNGQPYTLRDWTPLLLVIVVAAIVIPFNLHWPF